jgi:formate hydrogenlyase subunit 6/NADH:ubiquinone oxidoreductase subunit I
VLRKESPSLPHVSMEQGVTDLPAKGGYLLCLSCSACKLACPSTQCELKAYFVRGLRTVTSRKRSVQSNGDQDTISITPSCMTEFS